MLTGTGSGKTWDVTSDISEKVPTKRRRNKDKLCIMRFHSESLFLLIDGRYLFGVQSITKVAFRQISSFIAVFIMEAVFLFVLPDALSFVVSCEITFWSFRDVCLAVIIHSNLSSFEPCPLHINS